MSRFSRSISWLENLLFFWCGLTLILLIGGESLAIPAWLQVAGRLHPLVLHFPIVLLIMAVFVLWIRDENWKKLGSSFLLVGANFAGITVLAGLLLAAEDYEGEALSWHKWLGVLSLGFSVLLYFFQEQLLNYHRLIASSLAVILLLTGHFGANLTHGEDFLIAPLLTKEVKTVALEEAEVFRDLVQPIFETKCISCHKEGKIKGELRMDHLEGIQKGGKSGPFVLAGNPDESLLITRIHLPLENEEHMPPKNKLQLTDEELEILRLWVASGASFEQKVTELSKEEPLFLLASNRFSTEKPYSFRAADASEIENLNNFFRKVKPIFPGSPALEVAYFGSSTFEPNSLSDLKKVKEQVVKINLNRMPLENVDLSFLSDFQNLEEIQLNFTGITSVQLKGLSNITTLRSLAISGNPLGESGIQELKNLTQLKRLYLWQSGLGEDEKNDLKKALSNTQIDFGFDDKGIIYPLNPPKIDFEEVMFKEKAEVKISHPIKTAEIRYTLDGSEPDSIGSPVYSQPISLTKTSQIRAKAFAPGWIGSEESKTLLFKEGLKPQSYKLVNEPHNRYKAKGATSLFDGVKGKANHTSGDWLGFTDSPMEIEIFLENNQRPKSLEISHLLHEGAYIFPPESVEIWTGSEGNWTKIQTPSTTQSSKIEEVRFGLISFQLPDNSFDQLKVRLKPISKLPKWHPGAGAKGWVFVDEIVLY
ncbi:c-type cytochrome domain-containing protein [Algoriphagus sp. AK58]|uniref:FN3 associated domain-containing protein n=1 Tax=Algoriphagus sp. AK58 TaxID=1406877 RepID=UPI00164F4729|nr:c-type cytochrome domain-containing protein [Algoriphagus sp. AK58]MBC6365960.1 cytochrome C [Algoriphagus sp. AK58]